MHPGTRAAATRARPPRALLELGFGTFACTASSAAPSAQRRLARVLEKPGMRREAHFVENELVKGEWQSELAYAVRAQSQSRRLK